MDDLLDMIAADESKSAEKIDEFRPAVANAMFNNETEEEE
jgi:hypothetical protein